MSENVFRLDVRWNGTVLEAQPSFGQGWAYLGGSLAQPARKLAVRCNGLDNMTQFELGLFLATACRAFTDAWEMEAVAADQLELSDGIPGEGVESPF